MFAGQRIPLNECKLLPIGKRRAKQCRQIAIDFDGNNPPRALDQFLGQRARARPNLNRTIARPKLSRVRNGADQVLIDHEVLPKLMPRPRTGLGKKDFDLVLGLGHCDKGVAGDQKDASSTSATVERKPNANKGDTPALSRCVPVARSVPAVREMHCSRTPINARFHQ
jgi:hypothetical protein